MALDGSEQAEGAVPFAQELARQLALPLHLVRVVDGAEIPGLSQPGKPDPLEGELVAAQFRTLEYLTRVCTRLSERGLTVTTEVRRGRAGYQLLAATQAGDLVIIVATGRGVFHSGLGSVTYAVLGRARVPVLVVPRDEN